MVQNIGKKISEGAASIQTMGEAAVKTQKDTMGEDFNSARHDFVDGLREQLHARDDDFQKDFFQHMDGVDAVSGGVVPAVEAAAAKPVKQLEDKKEHMTEQLMLKKKEAEEFPEKMKERMEEKA